MPIYENLSDLIGHTPLLRLKRLMPEQLLYAKCEFMNPYSVKDRPVLQILEDAQEQGKLQPGDVIIEATSGNTGMALASLAAVMGYRTILVMSEIQSVERRKVMRALGAELILTPASEGTAGAKQKLNEILAEHPDYFYLGQHINMSNPKAHYLSTGPELWEETAGKIDFLVAGLGTGGTLCGAGKYLKEQNPNIQLIAVEPKEAPFISQGKFQPHRIMGTAPGFVPETIDRALIDDFELVSEAEAFSQCREIAEKEGLLVGISAGAATFAAIQIAKKHSGKMIVCILADRGERYLSVEGLFAE